MYYKVLFDFKFQLLRNLVLLGKLHLHTTITETWVVVCTYVK